MFQFGIGGIWCLPTGGNLATNPTPQEMLTIQDISVDMGQELKELVGQNKIADDVAPGQIKITGKFSSGHIDISAFNQLFFATTQTTGTKQIAANEPHTIPTPSGPYTIVVTNSTNFLVDLGVRYSANNNPLVRVLSGPITGQYSVSAGTYTFAAADDGLGVNISYAWTDATAGYTVSLSNQLMGYGPVFELWLSEPYQLVGGAGQGVHLWACRLSKLNQALKNMDYLKPEFEFTAFANSAGQVAELFQAAL